MSSLNLFDAYALSGEDEAEIDLLPIEADAAASGHGDGFVVERVVELRQAVIEHVVDGTVKSSAGHFYVQRLVWLLVVVSAMKSSNWPAAEGNCCRLAWWSQASVSDACAHGGRSVAGATSLKEGHTGTMDYVWSLLAVAGVVLTV